MSIEDFDLIEVIGKGSSGKIWKAKCKENNKLFALKVIDDPADSYEIATMTVVSHPNIVDFYGSFLHDDKMYLVMQLVEHGSLGNVIREKYPFGIHDEQMLASLLFQILTAIKHLHDMNIIHRDIKGDNVLIDKEGNIKLTDFGIAKPLKYNQDRTFTFTGTVCWMSPEILNGDCGYNTKADIWSFGITAIELATGHPPVIESESLMTALKILAGPAPDVKEIIPWSNSLCKMISKCLVKNPEERWTAQQLLNHKFFKTVKKRRFRWLKQVEPAEYLSNNLLPQLDRLDTLNEEESSSDNDEEESSSDGELQFSSE